MTFHDLQLAQKMDHNKFRASVLDHAYSPAVESKRFRLGRSQLTTRTFYLPLPVIINRLQWML